MSEVYCGDILAEYTLPSGSAAGAYQEIGVTWEEMKPYKRIVMKVKGKSNVGIGNNSYIKMKPSVESGQGYNVARFGNSGLLLEMEKIGEDLYKVTGIETTTGLIADLSITMSYIFYSGSGISYVAPYVTSTSLLQDDYKMCIMPSAETTIDYAIVVYGLTKEA